jgi:hypothetical protein
MQAVQCSGWYFQQMFGVGIDYKLLAKTTVAESIYL